MRDVSLEERGFVTTTFYVALGVYLGIYFVDKIITWVTLWSDHFGAIARFKEQESLFLQSIESHQATAIATSKRAEEAENVAKQWRDEVNRLRALLNEEKASRIAVVNQPQN